MLNRRMCTVRGWSIWFYILSAVNTPFPFFLGKNNHVHKVNALFLKCNSIVLLSFMNKNTPNPLRDEENWASLYVLPGYHEILHAIMEGEIFPTMSRDLYWSSNPLKLTHTIHCNITQVLWWWWAITVAQFPLYESNKRVYLIWSLLTLSICEF